MGLISSTYDAEFDGVIELLMVCFQVLLPDYRTHLDASVVLKYQMLTFSSTVWISVIQRMFTPNVCVENTVDPCCPAPAAPRNTMQNEICLTCLAQLTTTR